MRLCLISPPMTVANEHGPYPQVPPLGVAYLAASVREAGHDVNVVDGLGEALDSFHPFVNGQFLNGLTIDGVLNRVDPDADLIGLSVMFSKQWPLARRLLAALRDAFPSTPLVVGGEHVTAAVEHVFDSSPVDYVVLGEGEETLVALMDALADPATPGVDGIEGLAYRVGPAARAPVEVAETPGRRLQGGAGQEVVRNPPRRRRRDLDSIPWPAWDLLPIRNYIDNNRFQECSDRRVMVMLGTRGCPYRCRFCSNPVMWTTSFYMRSPRDLVDEIECYVHKFGATEFQFQDLTFVINRRWVVQVADEIISRNLNITWKLPGGTRSEAFDAELMARLSRSGCRSLCFAPESGSKRVLQSMRKQADPDRFVELGRIVRRDRIDVSLTAFIIIGSPEETLRDLLETYLFIIKLALVGYDAILVSRFTCYPGSEYHERYLKRGLIRYDDAYFLDLDLSLTNLRKARSWHPRWGARAVRGLVTFAYLLFFGVHYLTRPLRVLRSAAGVLRNRPQTRLELLCVHGFAHFARRGPGRSRGREPVQVA